MHPNCLCYAQESDDGAPSTNFDARYLADSSPSDTVDQQDRDVPMLESLHLKNVGPAPEMCLKFGPRINIITGDNGLGKSFLLDVAWWALTRKWPRDLNSNLTSGYPAKPINVEEKATIDFGILGMSGHVTYQSTYTPSDQGWIGRAGRPWNPGLVVYALADGGFAVWDPARNYWKKKGNCDVYDNQPAYVFNAREVWEGRSVIVGGELVSICSGLITDWAFWIAQGKETAKVLSRLLWTLTNTGSDDGVALGETFANISIDDLRDIPTIHTSYNHEVPIVHASMGVKRVAALAYMLLWAWLNNQRAAK